MKFREHALRALAAITLFGALIFGAPACGDDDTAATCAVDRDCPYGLICQGEVCAPRPCNGIGDCTSGDQACVTIDGAQLCAVVECGCPNCDSCPVGLDCDNGMCVGATACNDENPCAGTDVCEGGQCRPCAGAECGDCRTAGCPSGGTCNQSTGVCETASGEVAPCSSCQGSNDCGTGWKCVPLLSGNACLPPCQDASECPSGWECQANSCTPTSYRCDGCATDGCPSGEVCDPASNACEASVASCGACTADWQCGDGSACANGSCQPLCTGGTCAAGGACGVSVGGASVCVESCASACEPACTGATPICHDGSCVQCRNQGDCAPGQTCDAGSGLCTGEASCSGATPYPLGNACVECLTNAHCGARFCNQTTNTCGDDECAACADPYPACIDFEGQSYCVQCATDADCVAIRGEGSTCNTATYACQGGIVNPGAACESDLDCNAGAAGFNLRCHRGSGLCYDADGLCDDVTAFCPGTDGQVRPCLSFLEAFGGGGGGFPDMGLGDGMTIPGFCGCDITGILQDTCQTGLCMDLGAILSLLGGGGGGSTGGAFCFSL